MSSSISGIYKITNTVTGDFYIGSSKSIEKRWANHKRPSSWKREPNKKLYKDIQKYGIESYKMDVLEECDNLFEREQYWIDILKPTYNSRKSCNKKNHGISAVYKITCTITGDFYIGSSVNVKTRWAEHKRPSTWKHNPKNKLYKAMQKYGIKAFSFEILAECPPERLRRKEQEAIETLRPTYNSHDAFVTEESHRQKHNSYERDWNAKNKDRKSARNRRYNESHRAYKNAHNALYNKSYLNHRCLYKGEELTLNGLVSRFKRQGISHPVQEARKYIINETCALNAQVQ